MRDPRDVQARVDSHKKKLDAAQKHLDALAKTAADKALARQAAVEADAVPTWSR